mgnify:CR=1 FL=1
MRQFVEQYAQQTNTYFSSDLSITAFVVAGLAKNEEELGAPLCPCRHYQDKQAEVESAFWNCPCIPMRERRECHCMLFVQPDNDFAGDRREISLEQIYEVINADY